ncbi:MAG TPA: HAMP domain-containing sensor histidine kinase [Thermomicrobiales bacterium]|nr:HAMP domain-containing sensor histidine kinase [Thermomicrobiales bacterium]
MPSHRFDPALTWLRWTIVAAMLVITLAWPVGGRGGHPLWLFVFAFIGYNLVVELIRWSVPSRRSYDWVALFDLPTAGLLYFLDAEPGGPLFISFYVAMVTAAMYWTVRAIVPYTVAIVVIIVTVAPTLPQWSPSPGSFRQLAARIVVLIMIGAGTAMVVRRLTRQAEEASLMREEATRLEELDRLRSDFIASISHELRTPLTAIRAGIGFVRLSAGDRLGTEERGLLENAGRNAERLGLLIDDLLASNQLEAGILRLDRESLDLRAAITDAVAAMCPLIEQHGQVIDVELPDPLPIEGDARRLQQAMVNLLANANNHTPRGTLIALSCISARPDIHLQLKDNGPGIPEAELEAVFERFHRLDDVPGGSGLGLAIVRGIVELHGGRVWAERSADGGAVFNVTLPRHEEGD